jgi:hypothetical protein
MPFPRAHTTWLLALALGVLPACGDEVVHVCASGSGAKACARDAQAEVSPDVPSDAGAPPPDADASLAEPAPPDASPEVAGACASAPSGTKVIDVPGSCRATICDGAGNAAGAIVDRSNVPASPSPCLEGTCDELGRAGTAPLASGTVCAAGPGGKVCDGAGSCVECLRTRDCAPGLYCAASHRCGTAACTDLDCGGACAPCELGKRCHVDADCKSYACDAASATCIQSQCLDHVQDGNETDLDCGGGICAGCELGQRCLLDQDCKSQACDTVTSKCISDGCADHRTDGAETDVDCGGGACPACEVGKRCKFNGDCPAGHVCLGVQKMCS